MPKFDHVYLAIMITWYHVTNMTQIERTQTGLRLEKRLLKVLKGLAEHLEMPLGELVEGIALHALEGSAPFSDHTLGKIQQLKAVYDLDLTAADSHRLTEGPMGPNLCQVGDAR